MTKSSKGKETFTAWSLMEPDGSLKRTRFDRPTLLHTRHTARGEATFKGGRPVKVTVTVKVAP